MAKLGLGAVTQRINAKLDPPATYNMVLAAVHSAAITARLNRGRWTMDDADIPAAIAYFQQSSVTAHVAIEPAPASTAPPHQHGARRKDERSDVAPASVAA